MLTFLVKKEAARDGQNYREQGNGNGGRAGVLQENDCRAGEGLGSTSTKGQNRMQCVERPTLSNTQSMGYFEFSLNCGCC